MVYSMNSSSVKGFGIVAPSLIVLVRLVKGNKGNSRKLFVGEGFDDKSRFSR